MSIRAALMIIFLTIGWIITGCSSTGGTASGGRPTYSGVPQTPAEQTAYADIERLFREGLYDEVILRARRFQAQMPKSPMLASVQNLSGLSLLQKKRLQDAENLFRSAIENSANPDFRHIVTFNLATTQFELGRIKEANRTLQSVNPDLLDRATVLKFFYLRARCEERLEGDPIDVSRFLLEGSLVFRHYSHPRPNAVDHLYSLYESIISLQLARIEDPSALESLSRTFDSSPFSGLILSRLGNRMREIGQGRSGVIGALLPISGRFAKMGEQVQQTIQFALGQTSQHSVIVEDSGETPEQAIEALEKLAREHQVIAVIGPLLSRGVDQVTRRAQDLGVPLVSLAQQAGTPGDYIIQSAVTPGRQTEEVAKYAFNKLGLRRFAILFPEDRFGREYSQVFWDTVEALGGVITGVESYKPGEVDFREQIDRLSGLHYLEARKAELDELEAKRKELNITRRTRRTEEYFRLPPIVQYDAVFIADEARVVGQILPTFAYRDISKVAYLGTAMWNSPELIKRAETHANGAYFADVYSPEANDPRIKDFTIRFEQALNRKPTAIDATVFDAASIVNVAVTLSGRSENRAEIRNVLHSIKDYPGITGRISYESGTFRRDLKILSVQNGRITEVN